MDKFFKSVTNPIQYPPNLTKSFSTVRGFRAEVQRGQALPGQPVSAGGHGEGVAREGHGAALRHRRGGQVAGMVARWR